MLGIVVWGLGASLGFPVGMSAAADDPLRAARRVSVVSTIGYAAFLAGPPLLGLLGDHVGTLEALLVVAVPAGARRARRSAAARRDRRPGRGRRDRAVSRSLAARHPQHVAVLAVGVPGQDEEQVGEPVQVGDGEHVHGLAVHLVRRPGRPLGPAYDGARDVQQGRALRCRR